MKNSIEEVLDEHCTTTYNKYTGDEEIIASKSAVLIAMEEYGKQQWNEAIKLAAENVKAHVEYDEFDGTYDAVVNNTSILKLLK